MATATDRVLLISPTDDDAPFPLVVQRLDGEGVASDAVGPVSWVDAVREGDYDFVVCKPQLLREHAFERGQREVLELIASGAALAEQLEQIVLLIEAQAPAMICSILLLDRDREILHTGAAPHLPDEFIAAIDGAKIGPRAGSCGAAAHRDEQVIVEDIASHEYWADYRHLALPHGLRACWSTPIHSASDEVLGTFAMYYTEPRGPRPEELHWVDRATHIAAIALDQAQAHASERLHATVHDLIADMVFYLAVEPGEKYRFLSVNPAFTEATGLCEQEVIGRLLEEVAPPESLANIRAQYARAIAEHRKVEWYEVTPCPDGDKHGLVSVVPITTATGHCTNLLGTVHDITEQRTLELQLYRAQRLESLGAMASGIAHDFNNILTIISTNAGLAGAAPDDESAREALAQIELASERGADLVRQLLTFSRRQKPERTRLDLTPIVSEALGLLRASMPRNIELRTELAAELPPVLADATQLHQVVVNLVTNAAHAMTPEGGVLLVGVDRQELEGEAEARRLGLTPGLYVRLRIRDSGAGMSAATLERIFEPFFTTKGSGQGTGLGLAVVHGIVENHGGAVAVHSTLGDGTEFEVYLPADA
ncbi:MAG: ATP-binding protein [Enhygromyxa sp.]